MNKTKNKHNEYMRNYTREDFEKFYGKTITQNVLGKDYQKLLLPPKNKEINNHDYKTEEL